jgi:hypothetical protein
MGTVKLFRVWANDLGDDGIATASEGEAFSPLSLFASGEEGAWYDPSDLTTLWTDTAGTTQATVGDAVARMDDKSGNGNHATQATAAARPILRQSGSLYYLEFDGVDDFLYSQTNILGVDPSAASAFYAFEVGNTNTFQAICSMTDDGFSGGDSYFLTRVNNTESLQHYVAFNTVNQYIATTQQLLVDTPYVSGLSTTSGSQAARLNGVEYSTGTEIVVPKTLLSLGIGSQMDSDLSGGLYLNGVVYSTFVISRVLTATETQNLETYLADKSGVTL